MSMRMRMHMRMRMLMRAPAALTTPTMASNFAGASPSPVTTPPMLGLLLVTKGYVPKSMSSMVALAPSIRMRLPLSCASCT
jgi:hypothetical protein